MISTTHWFSLHKSNTDDCMAIFFIKAKLFQEASPMHWKHGTSKLRTPWPNRRNIFILFPNICTNISKSQNHNRNTRRPKTPGILINFSSSFPGEKFEEARKMKWGILLPKFLLPGDPQAEKTLFNALQGVGTLRSCQVGTWEPY